MNDIQLTPHFRLSEFTRSAVALERGIDNRLDPARPEHQPIIANLQSLCLHILEPLRQAFAQPIVINSGYRTPELNRAVGGSPTSQHLKGQAADLSWPADLTVHRWLIWLHSHAPYDQLILERNPKTGAKWLHISHTPNPRHQYIPQKVT